MNVARILGPCVIISNPKSKEYKFQMDKAVNMTVAVEMLSFVGHKQAENMKSVTNTVLKTKLVNASRCFAENSSLLWIMSLEIPQGKRSTAVWVEKSNMNQRRLRTSRQIELCGFGGLFKYGRCGHFFIALKSGRRSDWVTV